MSRLQDAILTPTALLAVDVVVFTLRPAPVEQSWQVLLIRSPEQGGGTRYALPGVVESAVIGVPHPDFGEGVTAIVVRKSGSKIDERQISRALDGRLAKFKLPKRILFADTLPRNAMGKVQKNVLRSTYQDLYDKAAS